jgi:hypothetical protein
MQLTATAAVPADARPTYIGLRVSSDREFSAPMFADRVQRLEAEGLTSALVEARKLLAAGAFDGVRDAAKAVVLLADEDGTEFHAGSLVELRMGRTQQVGVPAVDRNWEYWYEPAAVAVLDADSFELTR